ncbi:hypothetical protein RJ640_000515, partial [Escallonia rubra]
MKTRPRRCLSFFLKVFGFEESTRTLLDHLLFVAMDLTAYDWYMFRRLNCNRLVTEGVDFACERLYKSDDFIKMMWRRTLFLLDVLKHGYSFIFTKPYHKAKQERKRGSRNKYGLVQENSWSEDNFINTGFYYINSNIRTISLFEIWHGMKHNSVGMKEDGCLRGIRAQGMHESKGGSKQMDPRQRVLKAHDRKFEMSVMGELTFFLSLQIKQSKEGIFINQSKYTWELLKRFGMDNAKPKGTPISPSVSLVKDENGKDVDHQLYR